MSSKNTKSAQAAQRPSSKKPSPTEPLLDVRDLKVAYLTKRGPVKAVDGVSFSIRPGEVVGLAGESGSGKSTIAHAILRILHPPALITNGQVLFQGEDILEMDEARLEQFRWSKVSIVFQSAMNALNPVMKIRDQLTDVMLNHGLTKEESAKRAVELFNLVGIDPRRLDAYPHQLSGGMRQRAVIAIALALNPPLLIMDEPTTALDVVVQKDILEQISSLREKLGFSILFITHDLSLLVEISTHIAITYAGEIVEHAPARELFENPLHPYTLGLMNSFPSISGSKHKLTGIPGSPPDLVSPPTGCRFHPRCPKAMAVCSQTVPARKQITADHSVSCHLFDQYQ
ncbi:MAG TPA: ABC transporter ATP-binding protein [Anaerolineales bacterium]|nr:ABC transporter ATP-binding protein [Anaerolineales bacterium]